MNKPWFALASTLSAGSLAAHLQAQELSAPAPTPNWFSVGPQFGLNVTGRFKYIGHPSLAPGPAAGGINRDYNDGFVRGDSSGDAGGQTWNWGYQNASQVSGDTLTMHREASTVSGSLDHQDDPQFGFDLAYGRDLGTVLGGKWGLMAAFDFTTISIHDRQPVTGSAKLINDTYLLAAGVAPSAPYSGSYNGPGPLLNDTPMRTTTAESVLVLGTRTLEAQVYALRAGPYYDFPVWKRLSGRLGGGVVMAIADMDYTFNETVNYSSEAIHSSGSSSGTDFEAGVYVGGQLLYALTSRLSLYAGVQFEDLGTFSRTAGNKEAQLDMSSAVNLLVGLEWRF